LIWPRPAITIVCSVLLLGGACAPDGGENDSDEERRGAITTRPEVERPAGPSADLSEELTGGNGVFLGSARTAIDLDAAGWVEHEHVAAGVATSYETDGELPADGRFVLQPSETAAYRTRIVVRRPREAADFNGTVVVEWLNVSGGLDANPDFTFLAPELVRRGVAWVGVSAQRIGVEGGDALVSVGAAGGGVVGKGLKALDPERYGSLEHPGDAFSYDIFTQVARALRADASRALGDLDVERLIGVGESQSAFALTTYVNGVQPLAEQLDGFLIHSRGQGAMPLGGRGAGVDLAASIGRPPVIIRTDQDVPVLVLETETDVLSVFGYYRARQPDSEQLRLWEIAGTAHADSTLLGPFAETLDCGVSINDGPQRFAVRAALRALDTWITTGEPPPEAPRLEVDERDGTPSIRRDVDGNALGGIRFPQVDVPTATLSGDPGPKGGVICLLLGSTVPFTDERLATLYSSRSRYLDAYERATDAAIASRFALAEDRDEILEDADPSRIP
jgi:hypothetical protein